MVPTLFACWICMISPMSTHPFYLTLASAFVIPKQPMFLLLLKQACCCLQIMCKDGLINSYGSRSLQIVGSISYWFKALYMRLRLCNQQGTVSGINLYWTQFYLSVLSREEACSTQKVTEHWPTPRMWSFKFEKTEPFSVSRRKKSSNFPPCNF